MTHRTTTTRLFFLLLLLASTVNFSYLMAQNTEVEQILLDNSLNNNTTLAFSTRKIISTYTGNAMQVQRISDNTTMNIGFDANGNLDETTLMSFCAGTDCGVRVWYNQATTFSSAALGNLIQSNTGTQPLIVQGGVLIEIKTRPALLAGGKSFVSPLAAFTSGVVTAAIQGVGGNALYSTSRKYIRFTTTSIEARGNVSNRYTINPLGNAADLNVYYYTRAGGTSTTYFNGAKLSPPISNVLGAASVNTSGTALALSGTTKVGEFIVLNTGFTDDNSVQAMSDAQQKYFSDPNFAVVPTGLVGSSTGDGSSALLMWDEPGEVVTKDYVIEYKVSTATSWQTFVDGASEEASVIVTGLNSGVNYDFRVSSLNFSDVMSSPSTTVTFKVSSDKDDTNILHQILISGQSLSLGVGGGPVLSNTDPNPFGNLQLLAGNTFGELFEGIRGADASNKETMATSMANTISHLAEQDGVKYRSIPTLSGKSNTVYTRLAKGSAIYSTMLAYTNSIKNTSKSMGIPHVVSAIAIMHGESDQSLDRTAAVYETYLRTWQRDYEFDAQSITSYFKRVPLFTTQISSHSNYSKLNPTVALGQYNAGVNNPDVYVVAPNYMMEYDDFVHLNNYSYRRIGEYFAKAMKKVLVDGEEWKPLAPREIIGNNKKIIAYFDVPVEPLVFDDIKVTAAADMGFEYRDDSINNYTKSENAIIATNLIDTDGNGLEDAVEIILDESLTAATGNRDLAYAFSAKGLASANRASGRRSPNGKGNLRDSDTTPAYSTDATGLNATHAPRFAAMGNELNNWSLTFYQPIVSTDVPDAPTLDSIVATTVGDVEVFFTAPFDGGSSITSYLVTATASAQLTLTATSSTGSPIVVTGLEPGSRYTFSLVATNILGTSDSSNTDIFEFNKAPEDIMLSAMSVDENLMVGTVIGSLSSVDENIDDTHTYSLSGADASSFSVDGNSLKSAVEFNFEVQSSYTITITSTDNGVDNLTYSEDFTITIIDVNDTLTDIALSGLTIEENLATGTEIGMLSSTDEDVSDTHTYSLSGADASSFSVDGNSLKSAVEFNFEVKPSYMVTVTSTDSGVGNLTYSEDFTITIIDVNETPTDIVLSGSTIEENLATGTEIGMLSSTDEDGSDTHTYSLSGADASSFSIVESSLQSNEVFNFEVKPSYTVTVTSTDSGVGNLTYSKAFTISVTDAINEAPIDIMLSAMTISENLAIGTEIGMLSSTDEDGSDTHTYSLSGADASSFSIAGSSLQSSEVFDFEVKPSYTITVTSTDNGDGNLTYSKDFIITIIDVNEFSVTDITISGTVIEENSPLGTVIGVLASVDLDGEEVYEYSFSGLEANSFRINQDTLLSDALFDFETKPSYTFTINSKDPVGAVFSKEFTFPVTNVNEVPTDITLSSTTIPETAPQGTEIGVLGSVDEDAGDTHSYSLSGVDMSSFRIFGNALQSNVVFDFATQSSYMITVTTTDAGGLTYSKDFTLSINSVNEAPTDIMLSNAEIAEDVSLGTEIGTLTSVDVDAGDTHTYSLSGADASSFNIVGSSLQSNEVFDFETKSSYTFTVNTTDAGNLAYSKEFTVTITDVNEAPTDIMLSNAEIAEDVSLGTEIGTLSSVDADAGDTHTYSLSGVEASYFRIMGSSLQSNVLFDFETKPSYTITVISTDAGGLTYSEDVTLSINSVNEAPTDITISETEIEENSPLGTEVGVLTSADPDAGDTHTYSLSGADAISFRIEGSSLQSNEVFNFEAKSSYTIMVTSTDEGGLTFSKEFILSVRNLANERPTDVILSSASIEENAAVETEIGILSSVDVDAGDTHSYSLSGSDAASFRLDGNALQNNVVFDFETKSSYMVTITSTDAGGLTYSRDFTISITNMNEAISDIFLSNSIIEENSPVNTEIGTFSADDIDVGDTHTYTLLGVDAGSFKIEGNSLQNNEVFDFEIKSNYTITVMCEDAGGLNYSKEFMISVTAANEMPASDIILSNNTIVENVSPETTVGILSSVDVDAGDTHTYSLSGTDANSFRILGNALQSNDIFNYEIKSIYTVTVTTTDAGGLAYSEDFNIIVTNANELPTGIMLSSNVIAEDASVGTEVGVLSSTDTDADDTHSYSLSGTDAADFRIDGSSLKTNRIFDFDSKINHAITVTSTDAGGLTFSQDFTINIENVLGEAGVLASSVKVYPVPTHDQITLLIPEALEAQCISLLDLQGNTLLMVSEVQGTEYTIDLRSVVSGVYFLKIESHTGTVIKKILIE